MSDFRKLPLLACLCATLAGCGQTGKLYLPGNSGEVTTRSTQTPTESGGNASSPQTVDSPPAPDTPAPEVTAPRDDPDSEKDEKAKQAPAPESRKN